VQQHRQCSSIASAAASPVQQHRQCSSIASAAASASVFKAFLQLDYFVFLLRHPGCMSESRWRLLTLITVFTLGGAGAYFQ
jgi:hypothetical protein